MKEKNDEKKNSSAHTKNTKELNVKKKSSTHAMSTSIRVRMDVIRGRALTTIYGHYKLKQ